MKKPVLLLFAVLLAGCTSPRFVDDVPFLLGPVDLVVDVVRAKPRFDSARDRYEIDLRLVTPVERKGQTLHFVVDGVSDYWRGFTKPGSRWRIHSDKYALERGASFSFWKMADLDPVAVEEPIQLPETTRGK